MDITDRIAKAMSVKAEKEYDALQSAIYNLMKEFNGHSEMPWAKVRDVLDKCKGEITAHYKAKFEEQFLTDAQRLFEVIQEEQP